MAIDSFTLRCNSPYKHQRSPCGYFFLPDTPVVWCAKCLDEIANDLVIESGAGHLRMGEHT